MPVIVSGGYEHDVSWPGSLSGVSKLRPRVGNISGADLAVVNLELPSIATSVGLAGLSITPSTTPQQLGGSTIVLTGSTSATLGMEVSNPPDDVAFEIIL